MALRLMQDATHLVSNTPFVRFKVRFIRFGQSHPVKSRSKVVSLPPRNNYAKDMFPKNTKILNWQNGLLLSAVSYALYIIFWLLLDDDTARQLPDMTVTDYLIDFLLCMLFTYTSLGFCYVVFRVLPFNASYVRVIVYASCLLMLNNLMAFGMTSLFNLLWGETENGLLDELINMKGTYTFAMVATFLSSVYANAFYLQSYIRARDEKQALEMALMKEKETALQS